MANKTMHHVVIGDDTFELIDEAGREETTALKEDLSDNLYPLTEKHTYKFNASKIQVFPFEFVPGEKYTFKNTSPSGVTVGAVTLAASDSSEAVERITPGNISSGVSVEFTVTQQAHYLKSFITGAGSYEIIKHGLVIENIEDNIKSLKNVVELVANNEGATTQKKVNALAETNLVVWLDSFTVSSEDKAYAKREMRFDAVQGVFYGNLGSVVGGTSGNYLARLEAHDSNGTMLANSTFDSTYPATCILYAPAETSYITFTGYATLATAEDSTVVFSKIGIYKDSAELSVKLKEDVIIPDLENVKKLVEGAEKQAQKTFSNTGETNLDISFSIKQYDNAYIIADNTDITGHFQLYGFDGTRYTSINHVEIAGQNKIGFSAPTDFTRVRLHYIIDSIGTSPASNVTVGVKPVINTAQTGIIHVGRGYEYEDIQDAINECGDSETTPKILFIHNGEYSEFSTYDNDQRVRYISFIGESRCGVIVRGNKGTYAKPTAEIASFGAVRNMTFIQETSSETQEAEGRQPYCYALHDDYFQADTEYENCTFISNAGPAVGMGLKANKSKSFRNCTFINNGDGSFGSITIGAFFGHSESADNSENQELIIENCTAINEAGANGFVLSLVTSVSGATFKGVNVRNSGSFGNGQQSAYCTLPLSYSYGNNVDSLNVI